MSDNSPGEELQSRRKTLKSKLRGEKIKAREAASTWWFAVGLAGFIVLISGDLGAQVMRGMHPKVTSLLLTLTLVTGIALALSRALHRTSLRALEEADEILKENSSEKFQEAKGYGDRGERRYRAGRYFYWAAIFALGPLAAAVFLFSAWWVALSG